MFGLTSNTTGGTDDGRNATRSTMTAAEMRAAGYREWWIELHACDAGPLPAHDTACDPAGRRRTTMTSQSPRTRAEVGMDVPTAPRARTT